MGSCVCLVFEASDDLGFGFFWVEELFHLIKFVALHRWEVYF